MLLLVLCPKQNSIPVDCSPEDRSDEGADECAAVDGKVEDGEEGLKLSLLLGQLELISSKSGDAGLDAARANRDQGKADKREFTGEKKGVGLYRTSYGTS